MMSEEEMKERIEEVQKIQILPSTYFQQMFNVWPPKYHTFYLDYLLHPQEDDFWRPSSMKYKYDKIKVPVYFKCGWPPNGRWSAPVFNAMNSKELNVYKRCGVMEGYNGMELPYRFMNEEQLRWYDYWMKGIDTGIVDEPPMKLILSDVVIVTNTNIHWQDHTGKTLSAYIRQPALGNLSWKAVLPPDSFHTVLLTLLQRWKTDLPYRPLQPSDRIHRTDRAPSMGSNRQQRRQLHRKTAPDLPPGGTLLCRTGSLKASYPFDKEKESIGRPVHDYTKRIPVTPGEIREYVIEINPIGMVFLAGSGIELEIKAMDNFEPQPVHGRLKWITLDQSQAQMINYKIYRDKDYPSYILMPYIPETPGELSLQPIVDDDIIVGGSGKRQHSLSFRKGAVHMYSSLFLYFYTSKADLHKTA